ncbi:PepSY domain-containing protein [Endozoicomonas atrinae]|uniref:PepSY domain-containing protein n=1 Tax=Endozoicomonas atrinae TaxID=1333660 RepID=UPI00082708F2|nr:PepSY domain-containing protein [Endozoicomonas atrinae]
MKKSNIVKSAALSAFIGMSTMMAIGSANAGDAPTSLSEDAVPLLKAVEIARNHTGAEPLEAEREVEMGQAVYEIKLADKNGEEIKTIIDAQSGEVILSNHRSGHDNDHDDQLENALWLSGISNGKYLSLKEAVQQSESEFGGKVWHVEMEDDHNQVSYEIELLNARGQHIETRIDAVRPVSKS